MNKSNVKNTDSANIYKTQNPFDESFIAEYEYDTKEEIRNKLNRADEAFTVWSMLSLDKRKSKIEKFGSLLEKNKDDLAKIMTQEMGKPLQQSYQEIDLCQAIVDWNLKNADEHLKDKHEKFSDGEAIITYQPQGVILAIQPWNFPFYQAIRYSVPNLIAGNTTLLKHARNVWGCAQKIQDLYEQAGLNNGEFITLKAKSDDLEELYESKKIRGVTFTGSASAGRKIAALAGKNLKKTVLELGGTDAYIILKDANIDEAVEASFQGRITNNGETCVAAKRFLVEKEVYDEFKEKFVRKMQEAQMGDPMEKTTKLGPLARKDLLEKLNEQVEDSLEKGAICLTGGNIEKRKGYFFQPTVLENLSPGMPAYDEELFGPVASLIRVENITEAIEVANSTNFGLGGGIFGANKEELTKIAKFKLDTGMVNINGYGAAEPNLPFGGVKDSGYGREHASFGFHEFLNIKTIMLR